MTRDDVQAGPDNVGAPYAPPAPCPKQRVLLIEDETIIAMVTEEMLADLGYDILGPADTIEMASELIETQPFDIALVDINLHGASSFPLADQLLKRQIPFAFATGASHISDGRYADIPVLTKPYDFEALQTIVGRLSAALQPAS